MLNVEFKRFKKKKFLINYSKNDFSLYTYNSIPLNCFFFNVFDKFFFKKIFYLLTNLFFTNHNALFVDLETNYNYLPIDNKVLFSRSFSTLHKYIKYFNIGLIFYINLKKKKFIFKKLYGCNLINVSLSNNLIENKFDLNLNIKNNLHLYVFYLFVVNLYLNVKNKI